MSKMKSIAKSKEDFHRLLMNGELAVCHIYDDDSDVYVLFEPKIGLEKVNDMLFRHVISLDIEDLDFVDIGESSDECGTD